ncbi:hypothetical protein B0H13DRAFT_1854738 [Mycena leptocephala]|nr:hypothetical protein B0H13DRAFT_1854738 [Mycena leptocephala]
MCIRRIRVSFSPPPSAAALNPTRRPPAVRRTLHRGVHIYLRKTPADVNHRASATSAAELLTLRESGHNADDYEYDDVRLPGSPPSAYSGGGTTVRTPPEVALFLPQSTPPPLASLPPPFFVAANAKSAHPRPQSKSHEQREPAVVAVPERRVGVEHAVVFAGALARVACGRDESHLSTWTGTSNSSAGLVSDGVASG